ncbi:hypothetical protein AAF712_016038 [Marasmius tenuissimus]|uniref:Uncharacterized protein n=1 Tax=Marasmius tenuissimus TaxID=585030 RepID=A0ABR2Z8Z5_9AGAR
MTSKNANATLGHASPSPQKKRAKKDQEYLNLSFQASQLQTLQCTFDLMRNSYQRDTLPTPLDTSPAPPAPPPTDSPAIDSPDVTMDLGSDTKPHYTHENIENALPPPSAGSPARLSKKEEEEDRAGRWRETLKALVDPLLGYWDRTLGVYPKEVAAALENLCSTRACTLEMATVQVIYFDCLPPLPLYKPPSGTRFTWLISYLPLAILNGDVSGALGILSYALSILL